MPNNEAEAEMIILALDLGTTTGWAIYDGSRIRSGSIDFKSSRFESVNRRFVKFKRWLESKHSEQLLGLNLIYFEEVHKHSATDAAHAYGGFFAVLTSFCEENSIEYQGVGVKTIKKFIAATGNADKIDVIKAVQKLGFNPSDDNEADALALLQYALHHEKIKSACK